MASSYGALPTSTPAQSITIPTGPSTSRVLKTVLYVFRVVHLVLNLICIIIAAQNNEVYNQTSGSQIFFLLVNGALAAASCSLIIWYRVACRHGTECLEPKPIQEMAYYLIGSVLLFIASVIILARKDPPLPFPFFNDSTMRQTAGIAIFNAGLYVASAIMIWKLPRTN